MPLPARISFALGAIAVAAAIGLDAWHAHGLADSLGSEEYAAFGRGLRIHYLAGTGLALAGLLMDRRPGKLLAAAAAALAVGGLLFCGEVYRGALGHETLGLAPKGGMLSILGWLLLGAGALLGRPAARD